MNLSNIFFLFGVFNFFVLVYYVSKPKFRIYELLVFSLWFYYVNDPGHMKYVLGLVILNYIISLAISHTSKWIRKISIVLAIIIDLGILFIYKYLAFSISVINDFFGTSLECKNRIMVVGLSFLTFTLISYLVDVYYNRVSAPKNPIKFLVHILMFPRILMGPITRYYESSPTLDNSVLNPEDIGFGSKQFMAGMFKKIILADNLALLVNLVNETTDYSSVSICTLWLGSIAYSLQLFFDFSGYSDMAIGLARMLGYKFRANFNYPYCCNSFTDFWRRWHISLSLWFRDYIYIPLGGSRKSILRNIFNLLIVWILTGVWHGAGYNFIAWGIIYFVMLIIEKYIVKPNALNKTFRIIWRIFTLIIINFNWVLFSHASFIKGISYLYGMIGGYNNVPFSAFDVRLLREYGIYLLLGAIFSVPIQQYIEDKANKNKFASNITEIAFPMLYALLFIWALSFSILATHNPFLYQNF